MLPAASVLVFLLFSGSAADPRAPAEEIEALLRDTIEKGYREKDAARIVSAYSSDAEIVTPIFGKLSVEEFERELRSDFERLTLRSARLDLLEISFPDLREALLLFNLSVTGVLRGGKNANRHDRVWLLMREGEAGWKIHRHSYRRDFGVTEKPHDFTR
jgi:ketosteroid isomerase-like protein